MVRRDGRLTTYRALAVLHIGLTALAIVLPVLAVALVGAAEADAFLHTAQARALFFSRMITIVWVATGAALVVGVSAGWAAIRAARQAMLTEEKYRQVAENTLVGLFLADPSGRITYANEALCGILAWPDDRPPPEADVLALVQRSEAREQLRGELETQGRVANAEVELEGADGALRTCLLSAHRFDGHLAGVCIDVTERRRLQEEMRRADRLAAVGQLAAGLAHEFNNIMGGMSGFAQLARSTASPDAVDKLIDVVLQASGRASEITRSLLSFARPSAPRLRFTTLEAPIEAALGLVRHDLGSSHIRVAQDYAADLPLVRMDPGQMQQVFLNLFINAAHAMPDGGTLSIRIAYEPHAGRVAVHVTDTGHGIPAEQLDRIFEPFFTTKGHPGESETAGSGLGLSVSHSIVAAHGGTIEVRSQVGVGTTFTLWLPVLSHVPVAAGTPAADPAVTLSPPAGRPLRILVADDEETLLSVMRDLLAFGRHEVTAVADGPAAIEALQQGAFDLVFCDLLMPRANGSEVLQAARALPQPCPVVIMTGKVSEQAEAELIAAGALCCLRKPFKLQTVVAIVADVAQEQAA